MVSTSEGLTYNSPISVVILVMLKKRSVKTSLVQFLALLDLKQKTLSAEWDMLKQSARPFLQEVIYGIFFIIGWVIQKSIQVLKNPFIIGFYIIHSFCSLQYPMTALKLL